MTSLLSMAYGLVNKRSLDSKQKTGNTEGTGVWQMLKKVEENPQKPGF